MVKVKICGITNLEDALLAESLGADALGFIFTKKSPRFIKPDFAKKIIKSLGPFSHKVGVFMGQEKEEVLNIALSAGLDILQFHGRENFSYCNFFRPRFKVIKACFPEFSPAAISRYQKLDCLLFDLPYRQKIKGEKKFPLNFFNLAEEKIKCKAKVILSGGLNCSNLNRFLKIKPYGVDVASGVEKLTGKKDKKLMQEFIGKVKNASA